MECRSCGPSIRHDILYRCEQCQQSFCEAHINTHHKQNPIISSGYQPQQTQWQIDLNQFIIPRTRPQYHKPTDEEYEAFLRMNPQVLTSGRESIDLFIGFLLIAFVFGFRPMLEGRSSWMFILVLTLIIGPAFILHEMGHKYAAIHYGKYARFTIMRQTAYMSLLFGFIGIPLAGPGATMILGTSTDRETGIFAAAGPAINFILGSFAYLMVLLVPNFYIDAIANDLHWIFYLTMIVNASLGLFNLLPVLMLDGKKIMKWNIGVWILLGILNFILYLASSPFVF